MGSTPRERAQKAMNDETYVFFPKSLTNLEIETGGLLTLDDINLLNTVLEKDDSVLLERNLKSYRKMFE
jgi:hypothetical protein